MIFNYRITLLNASSAKYGPCEVCGEFVAAMYIQTKQHEKKIAGTAKVHGLDSDPSRLLPDLTPD